jgi:hypothetical protein
MTVIQMSDRELTRLRVTAIKRSPAGSLPYGFIRGRRGLRCQGPRIRPARVARVHPGMPPWVFGAEPDACPALLRAMALEPNPPARRIATAAATRGFIRLSIDLARVTEAFYSVS